MFTVTGIGPSDPKLAIVTDFPNLDEFEAQTCLKGKVGNTVSLLLQGTGIKLDDTYRTSVIKHYDKGFFRHKKNERQAVIKKYLADYPYETALANELREISPNAILALGETALNVLTSEKGLENYRGSILSPKIFLKLPEKVKIIPTIHPRELWGRWNFKPIVEFDYQRAVKYSKSIAPFRAKGLIWRVKDANGLKEYWSRASKGEFMVFDIETWRGYITCIGFCTDGREAVSVPLWDYATISDRVQIWQMLCKMLECSMPKINQNIGYDLHYIEKWGFRVNNVDGDTSILARCIYPEFNVRLAFLQSLYTELPYHKDEGHDYNPAIDKEKLYLYNAKDCLSTWQVYKGQVQDAKELKVWGFYRKAYWENNLFHIYRKMDGRGILIDQSVRDSLNKKYTEALQRHIAAVESEYGQPINIRSPKQVAELVYGYLECPKIYKKADEDGKRSLDTGKEALEEIYINKVKSAKVKTLLKRIIIVRKLETILNYINYFIHPDNRLRPTTKLGGTKSGRTSQSTSNDSLYFVNKRGKVEYEEFGGSLQVIPKRAFEAEEFEGEIFGSDISAMFVPSPGYCFIEGDGGAAEARVVCVLSNDFETLDMMDKIDVHRLTATWTLMREFEKITPYEREIYGKRPRHAGNYDMTEYRLSTMIHKPVHVCKEVLDRFHAKAPKIRGIFHFFVKQFVDNKGCLVSPHGRRRDFFGRRDSKLYKEAYSMIPQATVSDHTKFTIPLILEDVPSCEMLLEKHDSLLMEVPIVEKEYTFEVFRKHMERPISFREGSFERDFDLTIPAEIKWSETNWLEMQKVKF